MLALGEARADQMMDLRRCAACKNMISAGADLCPVCGLTREDIARARRRRWTWMAILLLVLIAWPALQGSGKRRRRTHPLAGGDALEPCPIARVRRISR
jgi:RNA polymerase subunit RPABC4/transcription elongation factor Spt4